MLASPPPHTGNGHAPGAPNGGSYGVYMGIQNGLMVGGMAGAAEHARRMQDLDTLRQIISQWNANRLDLFALTLPNEVRLSFGCFFVFQ